MRRNFKPYNKRKIYKRKSGGSKYLLNSRNANFDSPTGSESKDILKSLIMSLFDLNLGKRVSTIRTTNK